MTSNIRIKEDLYSKPTTPSVADDRMGAESYFESGTMHHQKPSFLFPAQFYKNLFAASASLLQKPPTVNCSSPSTADDEKAEDLSTPGPPPAAYPSSSTSSSTLTPTAVAHFSRNLFFSASPGSGSGAGESGKVSHNQQQQHHQHHHPHPHQHHSQSSAACRPADSTEADHDDVKDVVTQEKTPSSFPWLSDATNNNDYSKANNNHHSHPHHHHHHHNTCRHPEDSKSALSSPRIGSSHHGSSNGGPTSGHHPSSAAATAEGATPDSSSTTATAAIPNFNQMPVPGSVQGQNPTQGLVHWMSAVMAEHMTSNSHHDPTVGMHYMWNGPVEQCGQHTKDMDSYSGWPAPRNHMSMKQGYEAKMNAVDHHHHHNNLQKGHMIDDGRLLDHHGMQSAQMSQIYGARGASSNSSPGGHHVHPNSAGLLVVPQPINATKIGAALPNGTGRKYQCKMCPQSVHTQTVLHHIKLEGRIVEYSRPGGGLDYHNSPLIGEIAAAGDYSQFHRSIDQLRSLNERGILAAAGNTQLTVTFTPLQANGNGSLLDYNQQHQQQQHQQHQIQAHHHQHHQHHHNQNQKTYHQNSTGNANNSTTSPPTGNGSSNNNNNNNTTTTHNGHERIEFPHKSSVSNSNNNNSISVDTGAIIGNGNNLIDDRVNNNHLASSTNNNVNSSTNNHRTGSSANNSSSTNNGNGTDLELKHFIVEKKELKSSPSSPSSGGVLHHHQQQQLNLGHAGANGLNSNGATLISDCVDTKDTKIFTSKADLQLHTQIHMREAKPYKCSQCNKAFANSSYLSQHTRIHLGIKPYRCEICQRKFTQLSHLQQHIRTHTGDKPYKCRHPGCMKAFSQLSNLQSHSRCHQTDKPFKCNSCYKCFSDEPSLLEHIPKHKESKHLKTHICQYCGKSYTQETYLSKHMQKHSERTDKRPPIGARSSSSTLNLNTNTTVPPAMTGGENPYWPKVSPDSAANMTDVMQQQQQQQQPQPTNQQPPQQPQQPNQQSHHDFNLNPQNNAPNQTPNGHSNIPGDLHHHRDENVEDLAVSARQGAPNMNGNIPIPPSSTPMSAAGYDTGSIAKVASNSAFTPINSMPPHLNTLQHHHHQLAQRPYLYDAISFQNQKAINQSPSNSFPNQLISLHQIRNYAHQPGGGLMAGEHLLGVTVGAGGKDKG